jgi:predicted transcriptional regulator
MRRHPLGELEVGVLDRRWARGPADVKTMHEAVGAPRSISPNTVHSALERLVRKGLLARQKIGRSYQYQARLSRREWLERSLDRVANEMPGTGSATLLAAFIDLAERAGDAQLAELERLVRERRRRAREALE